MEKLIQSIVSAGIALQNAFAKAESINPQVLAALAKGEGQKRPVAVWFELFVALVGQSYAWPEDKTGKPVGYRTVMRKSGIYGKQVVAAAHFFNGFQRYLNGKGLVAVVKADTKGKRASKANVVTADDILKRLQAIVMLAPENKRQAVAKSLGVVAKQFGIRNADLSANIKRQ
jgi:hypothetical protein